MTTYDEKVLQLLVKGRDYLARPDVELHQEGEYFEAIPEDDGSFSEDLTRCCGMGAVLAGSGLNTPGQMFLDLAVSDRDVHARLRAAVADCPPELDFYEWNDHHAQSKDDVLAVFDRAIANLRAEVTS